MEPVQLVSSVEISRPELVAFLQTLGAKADSTKIYDGVVYRGDANVWIVLDREGIDEDDVEIFTQKLGNTPRTSIVIDISRAEGSEQLAVEIVGRFAERWPVVVDNCLPEEIGGKVFTADELLELKASGKGFWPQYAQVGQ